MEFVENGFEVFHGAGVEIDGDIVEVFEAVNGLDVMVIDDM